MDIKKIIAHLCLASLCTLAGCVIKESPLPDRISCIDCLPSSEEGGGSMMETQNTDMNGGEMSGGEMSGGQVSGGITGGMEGGNSEVLISIEECLSEETLLCEEERPRCADLSSDAIAIVEQGCWICVDSRTCKPIAQ